jgi:regulator of nucleoside diphosphate kinase
MKDKRMQQMLSEAIAAAQPIAEKTYHLCWWDDQIQCRRVRHTRASHRVFYSAPGHMLLEGFPLHRWRLLTTKVAEFCREQGIALDLESGRRRDATTRPTPRPRITEFDALRLRGLADSAESQGFAPPARVERLRQLLQRADVVKLGEIPEDVVTMNSEVQIRNEDSHMETTLALVFPTEVCNHEREKLTLSIFTDTGLALLGRRAGDIIDDRLRIIGLPYQPEAAGDFYG